MAFSDNPIWRINDAGMSVKTDEDEDEEREKRSNKQHVSRKQFVHMLICICTHKYTHVYEYV